MRVFTSLFTIPQLKPRALSNFAPQPEIHHTSWLYEPQALASGSKSGRGRVNFLARPECGAACFTGLVLGLIRLHHAHSGSALWPGARCQLCVLPGTTTLKTTDAIYCRVNGKTGRWAIVCTCRGLSFRNWQTALHWQTALPSARQQCRLPVPKR